MFEPIGMLGLLNGYSLALFFVLMATKAWRKSYSTTVTIAADLFIVHMWLTSSCIYGVLVMHLVNTFLLARAILHDNKDYLVRHRQARRHHDIQIV